MAKSIIEKIAEENSISITEVQKEMQLAIGAAVLNHNPGAEAFGTNILKSEIN